MKPAPLRPVAIVLFLLVLTGCVGAPQSTLLLEAHDRELATALPPAVILDSVPFFPQEEYQCGPAALATVLNANQVVVSPDELVSQVYVPARQGSLQIEMLAAPRRYGRIAYPLAPNLEQLLREVYAGRPVLVMQNLALARFPQWHYAVVVGYDLNAAEITLRSGTIRDYRVSMRVFERTWSRAENWAAVILTPGELPVVADEEAYFKALSAFESEGTYTANNSAYIAGLQRWPDSQLLGMGYGNLAYGAGSLSDAIAAYSRVLMHHPDYAAAHNNLAQALFESGMSLEAEEHARRAVALGGNFTTTYQGTLDRILAETAATQ